MALSGEKLIIAATLDGLTEGETFNEIPPHMTVIRWFHLQENRRERLFTALDTMFTDEPVFDQAVGGRKVLLGRFPHLALGRRVDNLKTINKENTQNPQWFALHALVKSLGTFDEDDRYKDVFLPHITDSKTFKLQKNKPIAFSSVALIGTEGIDQEHHVVASFALGRE
jgi:hypothetical protein